MPFDSNGVHSLPGGYLAVAGDTIQPSQHNPPLEDLSASLSGTMLRSGAAPFVGPIKFADGTVGAPGIAFGSSPSTGLYKTPDGFAAAVAGTKVVEFKATEVEIAQNLKVLKTLVLKDGGDKPSTMAMSLTSSDGNIFNITFGTSAITSIGTKGGIGTVIFLRFAGLITLTHHATDLILIGGANIVTAAGDWAMLEEYAEPVGSVGKWRMMFYSRASGAAMVSSLPRGWIDGCILSNNASAPTIHINISAGVCRDHTNSVDITLPALTKRLDEKFLVGTNEGMRNSAVALANGTYHIYAVRTLNNPVGDVYAHTSAVYNTVLAALNAEYPGDETYTHIRILGSILRGDVSGTDRIRGFLQVGDDFVLNPPVLSVPGTTQDTSSDLRIMTVPIGRRVKALIQTRTDGPAAGDNGLYVSCPDIGAVEPSTANAPLASTGIYVQTGGSTTNAIAYGRMEEWTNAAGQLRFDAIASMSLTVATIGWRDLRGKDA